MKAGGGYVLADMLCQFRVRACADRTRATGDRVRRRLLVRAIDAGARDLPHSRDARRAITASQGGRECLAHRLDLLWVTIEDGKVIWPLKNYVRRPPSSRG